MVFFLFGTLDNCKKLDEPSFRILASTDDENIARFQFIQNSSGGHIEGLA